MRAPGASAPRSGIAAGLNFLSFVRGDLMQIKGRRWGGALRRQALHPVSLRARRAPVARAPGSMTTSTASAALHALAAAFLALAMPARAEDPPAAPDPGSAKMEVLWDRGAYYTSVGLHIPLTKEQFPDGGEMTEWDVYRNLFLNSLRPRLLLLEASVYPMPVLGVYLRGHHPSLYSNAALGGATGINLIEAATAGFQEPWAVSAFVGDQMQFRREGEPQRDTNRGYMGYLVSVGTKHILKNVLIDDDWAELEWKLKGERKFRDERLSWSFRVGAKYNRNPDIADLYYLGVERSDLDFKGPLLSWLSNSKIVLKTEFTQHGLYLARQEVIVGKKIPVESRKFALTLEFGVIYERDVKYTGALAETSGKSTTLVLRPNIEF